MFMTVGLVNENCTLTIYRQYCSTVLLKQISNQKLSPTTLYKSLSTVVYLRSFRGARAMKLILNTVVFHMFPSYIRDLGYVYVAFTVTCFRSCAISKESNENVGKLVEVCFVRVYITRVKWACFMVPRRPTVMTHVRLGAMLLFRIIRMTLSAYQMWKPYN